VRYRGRGQDDPSFGGGAIGDHRYGLVSYIPRVSETY